jgi:hypothetical protein
MVTDYRSWLGKFIEPFPIADKKKVVDDLVLQAPAFFPRRSSDAMTHVRHVTPGDYLSKLRPPTIRRLDEIFSDALDALGYQRYAG